jgi:hypothetical protein
MSRNNQYIFAGILAIYIVFFTRPAPQVVANVLASPIAQLAVLGGVIYIGASVSLLVAIVAAIAVVLSMPVREYMENPIDSVKEKKKDDKKKDEKKKDDKKKEEKKDEEEPKPAPPAVAVDNKDRFTLQNAAPF